MDAQTSVRELIFLERSLPFAFVPFRQIGVGLYDKALEERATWALSVYRFPTDVFGDTAGDSGYGFSTRETLLLYDDDRSTIHVGGGYTYNRPATEVARLRSPPEVGFNQLDFRATDFPVPFFVDSGPIATDSYQVINAELALTRGPWFAQSEVYFARVDPSTGSGLNFNGAYAQVAYALTGETHPYNPASGAYSRITPNNDYGPCGLGAWEVAGRWSRLDLTDGAVAGGVMNDLTFGLNWYLNKYTKFQFNYIHVFLERPAGVDSEADVLALRAQLDF
ncbi:Porin P precursor [Botrimarina hoheduenensis]|uniref:Porin P n=1 Tax=Botrimarina hoheduenensis TaxID=2528000 RepID=A0A5C5W7X8_9BACT|nr:Porin P precursor [Botrimarina hoheduenensis]